jgi:hypothetical protein
MKGVSSYESITQFLRVLTGAEAKEKGEIPPHRFFSAGHDSKQNGGT